MFLFLLIICGAVLVHFFKMMRLYLVLMEHKMPFLKFVLLYIRTTFVNLAIPYKLGELYRIEEIARETKIWQVGFLSVLIDRFFDTVALTLLLLPLDLFVRGRISVITAVFGAIIIICVFFYLVFPASYEYLNRYMILKKASGRTMAALRSLDVAKTWYEFARQLIRGRFALILTASFLGWLMELLTLSLIANYKNISFLLSDFIVYIEAIFMRGKHELLVTYTRLSLALLLVLAVVGYVGKGIAYLRRKR